MPFRRPADASPYKPRASRHNEAVANETPMYVRPYLEDPVFLQPDDDEVALLHPKLAKKADEKTAKTTYGHHDLPGYRDLENPGHDETPYHEEIPSWIQEHRNTLDRAA